MDDATADGSGPTTVEWRLGSPEEVTAPIVVDRPYLELKLEHPDLDPGGRGNRFFPDAVPYRLEGIPRVFYWRHALGPSTDRPDRWDLVCASTHELVGIETCPAAGPTLVSDGTAGPTVVVDGTVAGDATTRQVRSYPVPDVAVESLSDSHVELSVEGTEYGVSIDERRRISLAERRLTPVEGDGKATTVTPELVVRYPGRRELHHPAPGASYRLFPSFGLDVDEVPNPLPIPTAAGELDAGTLATERGVDLSRRPYPERVLWEAFAYSAFDPHGERVPELTQLETGHVILRNGDPGE